MLRRWSLGLDLRKSFNKLFSTNSQPWIFLICVWIFPNLGSRERCVEECGLHPLSAWSPWILTAHCWSQQYIGVASLVPGSNRLAAVFSSCCMKEVFLPPFSFHLVCGSFRRWPIELLRPCWWQCPSFKQVRSRRWNLTQSGLQIYCSFEPVLC